MGAALDWLRKEYGGFLEEVETTVPTTAVPVAATVNDPDCLALVFVNFGAQNISLALAQNAPAGSGVTLTSAGGVVSLDVRDDLTLPSRAWFASSAGGASTLYVLKVRRPIAD